VPVLLNRHFVVPELALQTPSGPFLLTRYNVWIDETDPGVNQTIWLSVMEAMGYSTHGFLDAAARACGTLDLGHLLCTDPGRSSEAHKAMKLRAIQRAATEAEVDDMSTTDDDDDMTDANRTFFGRPSGDRTESSALGLPERGVQRCLPPMEHH
jgi:hypothetical protein